MSNEGKETNEIFACGADYGTAFFVSARDDGEGNVSFNTVRDCFRELPYDSEFESILKEQGSHYLSSEDRLYVIGNSAFVQAGMAEFGADLKPVKEDILKRPMKEGVLNPDSPKISMMILREIARACIEQNIGPARPGEIVYFSIPANPIDSSINNTFHAKMAEKHLRGLGYHPVAINEASAVIFSECPKMYTPEGPVPFTGIGISCGAGMMNFCLAERGIPLDEFSVTRSGDWIDAQVARMSGQPKTRVIKVKEKELNFNNIPDDNEILLALDVYYDELVRYAFTIFSERFKSNRGSIDHPIEIILSGGTASPPGFDKKVHRILDKMTLPFEIKQIRLAKDMLRTVANGCYLRAKHAAKKAMAARDALEK